jgi:ABC-type Na+ efflux pump permease subunit
MPELSPLLPILQVATTFSVFGLYYFVFGLFAVLGLIMLGIILMAEPDPQYDISEIMGPDDDSAEQTES